MSRSAPTLASILASASADVRALNPGLAAAPKRRPVKRAAPVGQVEPAVLPWSFTILGAPRTKNTGQVSTRGRVVVVPPAPWRRWFHAAMAQLPIIRATCRGTALERVDVAAVFYRDRNVGDEDRFKVGLGDFLQASGLVLNDRLIHWTGETRLDVDRARPRIEITISAAR